MLSVITNKTGKVTTTYIGGEEYLLVDAVAVSDDSTMNGLKYPADVLSKHVHKLVEMPVVYRHPSVNGIHVKAGSPRAISKNPTIGFVKEVKKIGADWVAKMAINLSVADKYPKVKKAVEDLTKGIKRGVSTGLIPQVSLNKVTNIMWDHLAILAEDEQPAGKTTFTVNSNQEIEFNLIDQSTGISWQDSNRDVIANSENTNNEFHLLI